MRSTLTKSGQCASFIKYSRAKVVLPAPFGPAIMMIRCFLGMFTHDYRSRKIRVWNPCKSVANIHLWRSLKARIGVLCLPAPRYYSTMEIAWEKVYRELEAEG